LVVCDSKPEKRYVNAYLQKTFNGGNSATGKRERVTPDVLIICNNKQNVIKDNKLCVKYFWKMESNPTLVRLEGAVVIISGRHYVGENATRKSVLKKYSKRLMMNLSVNLITTQYNYQSQIKFPTVSLQIGCQLLEFSEI
jgi:hypothetical protein